MRRIAQRYATPGGRYSDHLRGLLVEIAAATALVAVGLALAYLLAGKA